MFCRNSARDNADAQRTSPCCRPARRLAARGSSRSREFESLSPGLRLQPAPQKNEAETTTTGFASFPRRLEHAMLHPLAPSSGRRLDSLRELTPPGRARPRAGHTRSLGSGSSPPCKPGLLGEARPSSLRTPICIHTTLAPSAIASRRRQARRRTVRKTSTMSTGPSMSASSHRRARPDLLSRFARIDRDRRGSPSGLQILHGEIARPRSVGARPTMAIVPFRARCP